MLLKDCAETWSRHKKLETTTKQQKPIAECFFLPSSITMNTSSQPEDISEMTPSQHPGPFHQIGDSDIWIYSAFYEPVKQGVDAPMIRALGVAMRNLSGLALSCHVTYEDRSVTTVSGRLRAALDHHHKSYSASFLYCPVTGTRKPSFVAFSLNKHETPGHEFQVMFPASKRERTFTVCYSVIYGNYDCYSMLLQSITYNRMMGAEHFFLYNQTMGPRADAVVRHFQDLGIMTVLSMPEFPANEAWYHSQIMAINDCIYRNRNISEFVAVVDPDEFIMPVQHHSWGEVLKAVTDREIKEKRGENVGVFAFEHSMFCNNRLNNTEWATFKKNFQLSDEEGKFIERNDITTLLELRRSNLLRFPDV
ncbi:glycosyltransferase family 92 protein F13G3.3 [Aplysia californica]|uniref:Glycosyltransferase family 92 protein n=1 Tax=Aplysia californica TaxID=6500 RepID=A0ABM1VPJ2_APLCA|nr:glycosyltransferase family 92 protein F13G3.3 [Aplysia californica]